MKKMTFSELEKVFYEFNKEHGVTQQFQKPFLTAVVVYTGKGMIDGLTEVQRSYRIQSNNKFFLPSMLGNSLFGDCLDNTETGIRLDWYRGDWEVDYCYIEGTHV